MELSLRIYLIFGISFCLAAPPKKEDSVPISCVNQSDLLTVQGDIFKNCNNFKKLNQKDNFYSTNAENNTLCILYYNSLSAYCQLNAKSAKYPALQDIQNDIGVICENITPNLKTILNNSNKVTCYSLCSELSGHIRPECIYTYYYNTPSKLNLPDTELQINEVITEDHKSETKKDGSEKQATVTLDVSNKNTIETAGKTPKDSSNSAAGTIGTHVQGEGNPPPIQSPIESNSNTVNRDHEEELTNDIKSPNLTKQQDQEESLHENVNSPPKLLKDEKKDEDPKNIAGHAAEPPIIVPKANLDKKIKPVEEQKPASVDSPTNNDETDKNEKPNQLDVKAISDAMLDNPSNNANNDDSEYNLDNNNNAGDRTPQQDDANNGFEESVDTVAKLEDGKEIIDQKEEKKPDSVQDSPVDSENVDDIDGESYFFSYFMVICVLLILGYVGYHNRIKVMALLLEGKRGKRQNRGRRPNSANYHKLDTNLEEAISSNVTKNSNNVIY